ncbi:hypothetical protein Tco_0300672 [Tanacetum coccineum]
MVAYLKKPEESEGFHQIVDFLNASHIRYALIENPTIYMAQLTLDNGEIELTAKTLDNIQLADAVGISSLPTTEIFEQLSLIGKFPVMIVQGPIVQGEGSTHLVESHHTPTSALSTLQPLVSSTSRRTTRQEFVVPQPRSPIQTLVADETIYEERGDNVERAANTATSVDAKELVQVVVPSAKIPYWGDRPAQTSMILQELMVICTTLSNKVESLETDLKQTKQIYGAAYTRLIKKVKKLEKTAKSSQAKRRARIVGRYEHDMEFNFDFDTTKQVSTDGAAVTTDSVVVSTASATRNAGVSTVDDITMAETLVYIRKSAVKDKGKGKMVDSETIQTKTKLQQEQERLGFKEAVRLQAELEEEERQRIVRRLQAEEREKYTEADQARMLAKLINQRKRLYTAAVERAVPKLAAGSSKRDAEEKLDQESSKRQKTGESSELAEEPRDKEADELSQEKIQ